MRYFDTVRNSLELQSLFAGLLLLKAVRVGQMFLNLIQKLFDGIGTFLVKKLEEYAKGKSPLVGVLSSLLEMKLKASRRLSDIRKKISKRLKKRKSSDRDQKEKLEQDPESLYKSAMIDNTLSRSVKVIQGITPYLASAWILLYKKYKSEQIESVRPLSEMLFYWAGVNEITSQVGKLLTNVSLVKTGHPKGVGLECTLHELIKPSFH